MVLYLEISGTLNKTKESNRQVQRESIIEKIEADLYTEKAKKGRALKKSEVEAIIGNFGTIDQTMQKVTTTDGEYDIYFNEIIGWQQAEEDS